MRRAEQARCGAAAAAGSCTGIVYQRAGQGSWQGVLVTRSTRDWGLALTEDSTRENLNMGSGVGFRMQEKGFNVI